MKFEPLQFIRLLTISRRLALGFGLLIVVFLAYGVYSVASTTKIGQRTHDLHAHPMSVQRAVLEAELGIVKIHRAMKDVSLARSDEEVFRFVQLAEHSAKIVHQSFDVLRERFLGDRAAVDEAYEAYLDWGQIRAEVVGLKLRGDHEAAGAITQEKGAAHVALLEEKMGVLKAFAAHKADEFLTQSQQIQDRSIEVTQVLLVGLLLLGAAIAWATARSIQKPLQSLTEAAESIASGDFEHRVSVRSNDELGTLARAFNVMVENIASQTRTIQKQNEDNERLLLNILPAPIADRIKQGESTIADSYASVTVLFADLCGFTELADLWPAKELVKMLNQVFSEFDELAEGYGVEKIKTIGDAYMAAAGLPARREDHAQAVARLGLDMLDVIRRFNESNGTELSVRIGINTGPVLAGVIGRKKFIYDLWGDTVNIASRMESHGIPSEVQISASTYEHLRMEGCFEMKPRGEIAVKGKGSMETYMLRGVREA